MAITDVVDTIIEGTLDVVMAITITITIPTAIKIVCISHDTKFHHPPLMVPRLMRHLRLFKDYCPRIVHNHHMSIIILLQFHIEVGMEEWQRIFRLGMNLISPHLHLHHYRYIELHRHLHKHRHNCHSLLRLAMLAMDILHHRCRCL